MTFTPDNQYLLASFGGKINKIDITNGKYIDIPYTVDGKLELGPEVLFKYPIKDTTAVMASQIRDAVPSPDGKQLAFTVLNRLYLMDYPNGTPKRLTTNEFTEAQPSWSPDGKQIVFSTWAANGGHIVSVDVNGANAKALTAAPGLYTSPRYNMSGDRIVYVHAPNQKFRDAFDPGYDDAEDLLCWMNANGGQENVIDKANGRYNPHFSINDDRIYMNAGGSLISIKWDGTDQKHMRGLLASPPMAPLPCTRESPWQILVSFQTNWLQKMQGKIIPQPLPAKSGFLLKAKKPSPKSTTIFMLSPFHQQEKQFPFPLQMPAVLSFRARS